MFYHKARQHEKEKLEMRFLELESQLEQARETNRRLNRRCQELEALLTKQEKRTQGVINHFSIEAQRFHKYAGELYIEKYDLNRQLKNFYAEHYEKLPRNPNVKCVDGIALRVEYTLSLLKWSIPYQLLRLKNLLSRSV